MKYQIQPEKIHTDDRDPCSVSDWLLPVVTCNLATTNQNHSIGRGELSARRETKSCLRDGTEPAVVVPEVTKQHVVFAGAIAFGVFVNARASF